MPLPIGSRVGLYEVLGLLGAGGMGEVYRARDMRLGRDIALKILPPLFTSDPERLGRFEREARVLASLNHPNIAAIHGLEDSDGLRALILELVDGETLADRIARGPIPVREAVTIARQIADALDAAHEKGIVHRDLKPANVKITSDGVVKVLDFGLAKAASGETSGIDLTSSPTAAGGTRAGMIVGTAPYMSPEQARGLVVDRRSDIWSFGCLLFEMATGARAFRGETVADVLVGVLTGAMEWNRLPMETPLPLRRLLQRCLQKDLRRRLRDIGDARADLDELFETPEEVRADVSWQLTPREVEFHRLTDFVGPKESPAVSPDGKMVAFVAYVGRHRQIWVRLLAGGPVLQVTRDDSEHEHPRWAPDSNTLIYYTPSPGRDKLGTIWEVNALGGWPRRIASALGGGDISHDGRRIALFQISDGQPALITVKRDGSDTKRVTLLPTGYWYGSPRWAPDDSAIAFQRGGRGFDVSLEVVTVADGDKREVARSEWLRGFCWLPDGSGFVYSSSRGSTLLYPPVFNLRTIRRAGGNEGQLTFGDQSYADPDVHQRGILLASRTRSRSDIWKIPTEGSPVDNVSNAIRITRQTGQVQVPTVSPSGAEVAYISDNGGHANLWIVAMDGRGSRQVTFERDPATSVGVPKWSPAGDLIVFLLTRAGRPGLWTVEPDGSGLRLLVERAWAPSWSADGRWLYYQSIVEEVGTREAFAGDFSDNRHPPRGHEPRDFSGRIVALLQCRAQVRNLRMARRRPRASPRAARKRAVGDTDPSRGRALSLVSARGSIRAFTGWPCAGLVSRGWGDNELMDDCDGRRRDEAVDRLWRPLDHDRTKRFMVRRQPILVRRRRRE